MSNQTNNGIRIGQLDLQIPGVTPEAGQRIGSGVAEKLSGFKVTNTRRHVGVLNVRVSVVAGASESDIISAVSDSIIGALSKTSNSTNSYNNSIGHKK